MEHNTGRDLHLMDEAEQTLRAIRDGAVDAFVVREPEGHRVYTLEGSDLPYSTLVERMQQGAAMLDANGCIIYCNHSLARLLGVPREKLIGLQLTNFLALEDRHRCQKLLCEAADGTKRRRTASATRGRQSLIAAHFSLNLLSQDKLATGVLITDLTAPKRASRISLSLSAHAG